MAKRTKKPTPEQDRLEMWQGRLELAKAYRDDHGNQNKRWDRGVKALAGDFDSPKELGDEAIDVNLTYSTAQSVLPPLWLRDPYITFRPTRSRIEIGGQDVDNKRRAEVTEAEVNYWLRELKVRQRVTKPCVKDSWTTDHGYALVWYVADREDVEIDGERTEPVPEIRFKQPLVRRISPRHVLVPPGAWHLEMHDWLAIEWTKRLDDVKARYKGKADDLESNKSVWPGDQKKPTSKFRKYLESEDSQLVTLYQVFDKRSKKVLTLADGHDKILDEQDWDIEVEGFPIVELQFNEVPDEYHSPAPVTYSYNQQKELNAARTAQRKRFNRSKAIGLASSEMSEDQISAYKRAKDGEIIKLEQVDDARKAVMWEQLLPQDPSVLAYQSVIRNDMQEIDGVSAQQRGSGDPLIDTATESSIVETRAQVRDLDRADRVREFYFDIARKLVMILRQFPDEERERLVAGPIAGQFTTLRYSLRELEGEYALEMDLGTLLPDNPQRRQAQANANYNLLRADPLVNPEWLITKLIQSQNEPNPEAALLFLREPEEELQMMLQALPVEPHERDNHERHLQEHDAQLERLMQVSEQVQDQDGVTGRKVRMAMALLVAHINSTMRVVQGIVGQSAGRQPGSPLSENLFRNQQTRVAGSETAAELTGQPLNTPAGAGVL